MKTERKWYFYFQLHDTHCALFLCHFLRTNRLQAIRVTLKFKQRMVESESRVERTRNAEADLITNHGSTTYCIVSRSAGVSDFLTRELQGLATLEVYSEDFAYCV